MTDKVPAEDIEAIVGAKRHPILHIARAVSADQRVYVLHSERCVKQIPDLRDCAYSLALDNGINPDEWIEDTPVTVRIIGDQLVPLP